MNWVARFICVAVPYAIFLLLPTSAPKVGAILAACLLALIFCVAFSLAASIIGKGDLASFAIANVALLTLAAFVRLGMVIGTDLSSWTDESATWLSRAPARQQIFAEAAFAAVCVLCNGIGIALHHGLTRLAARLGWLRKAQPPVPGTEAVAPTLQQMLAERPWNTLTYRLLRLIRRFFLTVYSAPFLILLYVGVHPAFMLLLPVVMAIDVLIVRRAWDQTVPEDELASAVFRQAAVPHPFDAEAKKRILWQFLTLLLMYVATTALAVAGLWSSDSESTRRAIGWLFAVVTGTISIVSAGVVSANFLALPMILNKGQLHPSVRAVNNVDPGWTSPLFWLVPEHIRKEAVLIVMVPLLFACMSLHALYLGATALESKIPLVLWAPLAFIMSLVCGAAIALQSMMYLGYRVQRWGRNKMAAPN